MRRRYEIRVILGILLWIGLIRAAAMLTQRTLSNTSGISNQLVNYVSNPRTSVQLEFEEYRIVQVGDPIYYATENGHRLVGRISLVESDTSSHSARVISKKATAKFFSNAPDFDSHSFLESNATPDSLGWVVQTMLPPEKRAEIAQLILGSYREHQKEIIAALRPIVEETLRDASHIIREDFQIAFDRREVQINQLGQRFQSNLVEKELIPLVKDEIWPIIQTESQPLVEEIGSEMWKEVSLWRFTWRYLYDASPLPERKLAQQEFRRFLDGKAVPILESHITDIIDVQKDIIQRISRNNTVKKVVSKSVKRILNDEEVQQLLKDVFREVFVNNPPLQDALEKKWQTPEAQAALDLTNQRLDPTITAIGQSLFGSFEDKITPEFARVLRFKILNKDHRWFILKIPTSTADSAILTEVLPVVTGDSIEIPLTVPAKLKN